MAGRCIARSTSSGITVGPGIARNSRPARTVIICFLLDLLALPVRVRKKPALDMIRGEYRVSEWKTRDEITCHIRMALRSGKAAHAFKNVMEWMRLRDRYRSGSGMNSVSSGTLAKRPVFQSSLACSIRSLLEETKFHQMCRGPSSAVPPRNIMRAFRVARTVI